MFVQRIQADSLTSMFMFCSLAIPKSLKNTLFPCWILKWPTLKYCLEARNTMYIVFMFSLDISSNIWKSDSQERQRGKTIWYYMYLCFPESYKLYFFPSWFLRIDTSLSLAFSVPTLCITLILYIDSGWGFRWCQWVRRTAACTWSPRATMSSSPRRIRDICDRVHRVRVMAQHWAAKLGRCLPGSTVDTVDTVDTWQLWQFDFTKKKEWHFLTLSFGKLLWMPCHPSLHPGTPWLSVLFSSG